MLSEILKNYKSVDTSQMRATEFLKRQREIEVDKIERVRKRSGFKSLSSCPLCGSKESRLELTKHSIDLLHCLNCDVRFNEKIPANLDDIYDDENYVVHSKEDSDGHFNYRKRRFGFERVHILETYCGDLKEKRMLDVGCGTGFFISAAKEKCKYVYGSEFSDIRRAEAVQRTGLAVFSQPLDELPERDMDIITAFDLLEHIPEPIPFMRSVDDLLKPGGFVFLYVPNFDSFSMKVMRENSPTVDSTEHVLFYNQKSLEFIAKAFGYRIVHTETQGMDIENIIAFYQNSGEAPDSFLLRWKHDLQAIINAAQCADSLRAIFQKPPDKIAK